MMPQMMLQSDRPARGTRDVRLDVRSGVRPDVRPDVRAAPVSSEGKKKNAGCPGGGSPPAKPVKGGVWGGKAPP